ncbi:MAG: translation elongation factor Ts [Candidatus Hydrogenedentes bacterium]|nr:translation elongation factor Ts [Candidatus Hydrogenedentota bacterium]
MAISASDVKSLREKTGAGMMDCKKALTETDGEYDAAITWLREKGMASASKRDGKTASEGAISQYIHMRGKIGVLAEINCETDFVARGDEFQALCKDICLQICSTAPRWIRREEVPQEIVDAEMDIYRTQALESGKPEKILDKIVEGKLNKFYEDTCLLEQKFVKESKVAVGDMVKALSGKIGEKIEVRRFSRFQLGEGIEKEVTDFAQEVADAVAASQGD